MRAHAIAVLSAELGKELIIGLIERIRDEELAEEAIAHIIQEELDKRLEFSDLRRFLEELNLVAATLQHILNSNNAQLRESLHADIAVYPSLISDQAGDVVRRELAPRLHLLSHQISTLDAGSQRVLVIFQPLTAAPIFAMYAAVEHRFECSSVPDER